MHQKTKPSFFPLTALIEKQGRAGASLNGKMKRGTSLPLGPHCTQATGGQGTRLKTIRFLKPTDFTRIEQHLMSSNSLLTKLV